MPILRRWAASSRARELDDVAWDVERGSISDQREASGSSGHDPGRAVLPGLHACPASRRHPKIISLAKPQGGK
ncbi:hypothetical protein SLI_8080 [Streptomyces lividans 1326]|uniref:Uncharacterized protein n=1 Tax=Streptomyces lividans 1326 TaxID=1200984 RepID=A0A7U9E4P7_STRLI|nr:hypothetical protein SLI_8080 [Streptomyces lividans 1326]